MENEYVGSAVALPPRYGIDAMRGNRTRCFGINPKAKSLSHLKVTELWHEPTMPLSFLVPSKAWECRLGASAQFFAGAGLQPAPPLRGGNVFFLVPSKAWECRLGASAQLTATLARRRLHSHALLGTSAKNRISSD
jgi:hypothetical protein